MKNERHQPQMQIKPPLHPAQPLMKKKHCIWIRKQMLCKFIILKCTERARVRNMCPLLNTLTFQERQNNNVLMKLGLQLLTRRTIRHHLQWIGSIKQAILINQTKWAIKQLQWSRSSAWAMGRRQKDHGNQLNLNLGVHAEQSEECVHVDESLSGLSVHSAQEVEGHWELEEESVNHHQISYSHGSFQNQQKQQRKLGMGSGRRIYWACVGDA